MKLAIGVGCRKGCASQAIVAIARRALERAGYQGEPAALYTHQDKDTEPGLIAAASELQMPLVFLGPKELLGASAHAETRSEKVLALFGVPSIAETAALAGAGEGSRLIVPRISEGGASCAVAKEGS